MGTQLALIGGEVEMEVDHTRTALKAERHRKMSRPTLWLFEVARPPIRSRKLKVSPPRRLRAGRKPQSIGCRGLTVAERNADALLRWELEDAGVYAARPKKWGDCRPLACPWCGHETVMVVVTDSDGSNEQYGCPECLRPVRLEPKADGFSQWVRERNPKASRATSVGDRMRARNHAGKCPWISCRFHNYLDVDEETGALKIAFPGRANKLSELGENVDEMPESCALRVAQRSDGLEEEMPLDEIGKLQNVTLERVAQVLRAGLAHVKENREMREAAR